MVATRARESESFSPTQKRHPKRAAFAGVGASLCIGLLVSCGGGGYGGDNSSPPATLTISVSPTTITLGQSATVTWNSNAGTTCSASGAWSGTKAASGSEVVTPTQAGTFTYTLTCSGGGYGSSDRESATLTVSSAGLTRTLVFVRSGGAHTCALTDGGAAYCWGRGESGQLGAVASSSCTLDAVIYPCELVPVAVGGGLSFTQITAGGAHTCALTGDGMAYCWGSNESGQLGDNSTIQSDEPVAVATGLRFGNIDAGANHTCGLTAGGAPYCWGRNDRGQLGDGTNANRLMPAAVTGGLSFEIVTAGGFDIGHTCGIIAGGAAYCWGDNERGQLGIGTTDLAPHPVPGLVSGGLTFVSLTAGLGRHTCALTDVGAAYCWGENTFGALGDGSGADKSSPVVVSGGLVFDQLIAGGFIGHTCGLSDAGAAYCWGENERGQVGDGSTTDRSSPSAVVGGLVFASLDAGFRHTCALSTSGTLYCWGSGASGQLGTGSTSQSNVPVKVFGQP